jgi:hypothetical protein
MRGFRLTARAGAVCAERADPCCRWRTATLAATSAVVFALTAGVGTAAANTSLLSQVGTFGSQGAGPGQLSSPAGVAIQPRSGNVYVADTGNARVDKFGPGGKFIAAFGWGVSDGKAQAEVCTSSCQAGIAGSGPGQLSNPTSIAFGVPGTPSAGKVFVADTVNDAVEEFDADGNFVSAIDGTSTPQGHFQSLVGMAVDRSGNLWTADGTTNNIDEFNANGAFVQQWPDTHGSPTAIAVDSTRGSVYITSSNGGSSPAERWTLTGQPKGQVDRGVFVSGEGSPSALAVDMSTGNLYVDHIPPLPGAAGGVAVYDATGTQIDDLPLVSATNSQGLAFRSAGPGEAAVAHDLYVSDATNDNVTIFAPRTKAGAPLVASQSVDQTGKTTATLHAGIVPLGNATTCQFQYVDNAGFRASGFKSATTVACMPANPGSGFSYKSESAPISGLTLGTIYHFRVVASSGAGTATGADQEFPAGPGEWAPLFRCPVDDPAMLASDGTTTLGACLGSNSTHGSITIGNITATTGSTNLQAGLVLDESTGVYAAVQPAGGALVANPVHLSTPVGPVTAVTESAGAPSNFSLFAGITTDQPIITIPIKIHLESPTLGPSCFIGSDQNPILLNPQNTDLSRAKSVGGFTFFDPDGVPDSTGPLTAIEITRAVEGDNTFAVPGATGCGTNDSLDAAVDAIAGVPSPSGHNQIVLDDASSAIVIAQGGFPSFPTLTGQQFANDWHVGFG